MNFDQNTLKNMDLTPAQIEILRETKEEGVCEPELFEKLGMAEEGFAKLMRTLRAFKKEKVFRQEVSEAELSAVSGGEHKDPNYTRDICEKASMWRIDDPSFPSCNSTVEDGSWCTESDACWGDAIVYVNMKTCKKAWE